MPNRLYVTYHTASSRSPQSIDASVRATQSVDIGDFGGASHRVVTLPDGTDLTNAASTLRSTSGVVDVQPLHYRSLASDTEANDPFLREPDQWYLYRTSTDVNPATGNAAWNLTKGSLGIKVAVIDTGIDQSNIDLTQNLVKAETILSGVVTPNKAQDTNGHGTNVAGLAAAATNNNYGFAGEGYNVGLLAYKIFPDTTTTSDCQQADTGDEAKAIADAVASGANVINLSLGGPQSGGSDPAEQQAVANAIAAGVTVVAAGGNEFPTSDGNQPDFPGAYPGVIAVGASGNQHTTANDATTITADTVASYSNSGVTLLAPGGDAPNNDASDVLNWIEGYSTTTANFPPDKCSNTGGVCRALFNGTSQSTPQVSGAVALMMAYHGGTIAPATVKSLLTSTASALPGVASTRQGAGLLNAFAAVQAAK